MKRFVLFAAACLVAGSATAWSADVAVHVGTTPVAKPVGDHFVGLSFETTVELPHDGTHYFRADNPPLLALFKTLGIRSLRVGGNAVDDEKVAIPDQADVDSLFAFAKAADVNVIYSFRTELPAEASVPMAKYIAGHYASQLDALCIGNEPEWRPLIKTYAKYMPIWEPQFRAITAACPDVKIGGPCSGHPELFSVEIAKQFGPTGKMAFIGTHCYFLGRGPEMAKVPAGTREKFLDDALHGAYETADGYAVQVQKMGLRYRFDETNNCSRGGARGVSDTFVAALWGLDYLHWWAAHDLDGINFHTASWPGGKYGGPAYTAYTVGPDGAGYRVAPLGYALAAFNLSAHGRPVQTTATHTEKMNFDAYTVRQPDGGLVVTLINKSHGPADVRIDLPAGRVERMDLVAPGDDFAATTGESLGGQEIKTDGTWAGAWTPVASGKPVTLRPTSATVLKWTASN